MALDQTTAAAYVGVGILTAVFFLYVWSVIWTYQDARNRAKPGGLAALLVALYWPLGLIAWLLFRPDERPTRRVQTARIPCSCGIKIHVDEQLAGLTVQCPRCKKDVAVPELSELRRILAEEGRFEDVPQ